MCNECQNSHAKFGGAARCRFYAIWKTSAVGRISAPPPSVRVLTMTLTLNFKHIISFPKVSSFISNHFLPFLCFLHSSETCELRSLPKCYFDCRRRAFISYYYPFFTRFLFSFIQPIFLCCYAARRVGSMPVGSRMFGDPTRPRMKIVISRRTLYR